MKMIITMKEWECKKEDIELNEYQSQLAQEVSESGVLTIIENKRGITIQSNSRVGKINLGGIEVIVSPKIEGMIIYNLLVYTYGLNKFKIFDSTEYRLNEFNFLDLVICQLYFETENLLKKGLYKNYYKREDYLHTPKGRIDFSKICRDGGILKEKLPYIYFNREEENLLNQIVLSGLKLAKYLVSDENLSFKLTKLINQFPINIRNIRLTKDKLAKAYKNINRGSERYSPILKLIEILYESRGIDIDVDKLLDITEKISSKGFFFDMNLFFEALVIKVVQDFSVEYTLKKQYSLKEMLRYVPEKNPCNRRSPMPRPDFALYKNSTITNLVDVKYRDLWNYSLPEKMLYQLLTYASSGIGNSESIILYSTSDSSATVQEIEMNNSSTGIRVASVSIRPINLNFLSKNILDRTKRHNISKYIDNILNNKT